MRKINGGNIFSPILAINLLFMINRQLITLFFSCLPIYSYTQTVYGKIHWNNQWKDTIAISEIRGYDDFYSGSGGLVVAKTAIDTVTGLFNFKDLQLDTNLIYRVSASRKGSIYGGINMKYPYNNYLFFKLDSNKDTIFFETNIDSFLLSSKFIAANKITKALEHHSKFFISQIGVRYFSSFNSLKKEERTPEIEDVFRQKLIEKIIPILKRYFKQLSLEKNFYARAFGYCNYQAHSYEEFRKKELNEIYKFYETNAFHPYAKSYFKYYSSVNLTMDFPNILFDSTNLFQCKNPSGYTVVKFWATWCTPCLKEMSELNALLSKNKAANGYITFIGVNVDNNESVFKKFMGKNQFNWKNFWLRDGMDNPIYKTLKIQSLPRSFLIDANHKILNQDISLYTITQLLKK